MSSKRITVIAADSSSDPPQPSLLEKKRNTPLRYP